MKEITIVTLFPDIFTGPFNQSILKRAQNRNLIHISLVNLRDYATDSYKTVDGKPYGGGQGMVLRVDVVDRCLTDLLEKSQIPRNLTRILITDPRGEVYSQSKASQYLEYDRIIIICGHYEGADERIIGLVDEQVSVGEYILTGGEIPAMIITDSITRLIPGVLKNLDATRDESFSEAGTLEYPQYTEPREYQGKSVPDVLIGGNHKLIAEWKTDHLKHRIRK
jgi:tRNA (guanine37-N1)-methyltransferase